jgi:hypothetical protein
MAAFVKEDIALTKTGKQNKWFYLCDPFVDFFYHTLEPAKKLSYAELEMHKLKTYNEITDEIVKYVKKKTSYRGVSAPTKIFIEGYSFSSAAGPLIDLVTFSTLLRIKLRKTISEDITVLAPMELKLAAAKLTYPPTLDKKKEVWMNKEGVKGGSFKKPEMYMALIDNENLQCDWVEFLREYASDILAKKAVPKPIEDLNDAKLLYEIARLNK